MRATACIGQALLRQRGYLFPWVPVCLGLGIGLYFGLRREPGVWTLGALGLLALFLAAAAARAGERQAPLVWALMLVVAGVPLAGLRSHWVAQQGLGWRYYGPVEGRIVGIDRSASDAVRLTLADVRLYNVPPGRVTGRVRVSLHGQQGFFTPAPGQRVAMTAHLSPPQGPVEPGGFDFQRHAWFQGLAAVGYTRSPALLMAPSDETWTVFALRMALSAHIRNSLPGEVGGFAAAVTTGDRSGIAQTTLDALRDSNLAHLLAISGLHMGLLVGFVFAALRYGLALLPAVAMRLHAKRVAAVASVVVAAIYLGLSGGNVATQRAFVMAAVALVAVMADRRVISLRAVALAALVVLVLRPDSLLSPGFHMSFAATAALVAVFGALREREIGLGPAWLRPVSAVVISSLVAGLATAPFGAAHFNQLAHYGLLANLLAVPVMGGLVIPAAVLAALLAPLGLGFAGLWLMGVGLRWILHVAETVAGFEGATSAIVSPGAAVLPLLSLGALFLILWQGRERWAGLVPVVIAALLWGAADRPDILISDNAALVGVMTAEGRALSRARGHGFIARNWLENDGAAVSQESAAVRWPEDSGRGRKSIAIGDLRLIHLQGKRALAGFTSCAPGDLVIASVNAPQGLGCTVYDPQRLRHSGALAIRLRKGRLHVTSSQSLTGSRLWNRRPRR